MRDYSRIIGRRVFLEPKTRRPVKKGDVILSSLPFAHVLSYYYLSMYCDTCASPLRERLLHPCGECRVVWYCSEECRHAAQAWHRLECFALKRRKHNPPGSFVRLLARVIFRLRDGGDMYEERYCDKGARRFRDLMNHYVDLKNNEDMKPEIDMNLADLRNYIGERLLPNESDLLGIYGRTLVNCFSFADKTMLNIGCAVYLAASVFDHDCSPNCFVTFSGLKVEIRSLIDMPDLDFAKCHISYMDPVSTVAARRQDLYKGWFFLCKCKTCEDKEKAKYENSIKCKMPSCSGLVSIPEASDVAGLIEIKIQAAREKETRKKKEREEKHRWRGKEEKKRERVQEKKKEIKEEEEKEKEREGEKKEKTEPRCSVCGWMACSETIRQYWDTVAFTKERLKAMDLDNLNIENCLQILERQKAFSSMNAWRVRTLDFIFNAAILNSCWSLAMKYGEENHDGMRFYYGVKNPIFYIFLFKLGKTNIYLKEFREGLRILEEAESWLITGLGDSHPIVEELRQLTLLANEDREICLERWHEASKKHEEKLKIDKQEQLQQLPFLSSQNESLARIFDTLSQMYCSLPKEVNGV